jgi:hypothetical protein
MRRDGSNAFSSAIGGAISLVLLGASSLLPAREAPSAAELELFEAKVRPLLAERCYRCHGPERQRASLRLDSFAAMLRGGASGPALVPGRPEESLILRATSYRDPELQMPPDGKLSERDVALLRRWVEGGARHPELGGPAPERPAMDLEAARRHWAFQPPSDPPAPAVSRESWPRSPLDRFILARLEAAGLAPAPPADRRTLIRRATFDLTGLPPAAGEIEAFLADTSGDAFERLVERLLASPRYGERWGRHWLDVARYADSNGLDENIAHGNAWRYRDYVVAAFNRDKPYDEFIIEQLAGDLLPAAGDPSLRHERLIATGFLSLGPKVLAEVDEGKMEMDIVDEQVDTTGRAFLGLTIGCARCHDHKFEPISTEDYYALAGIFKSTRTMESFTKIARWHENLIASAEELELKAAHERRVAEEKAAIEAFLEEASREAPPVQTSGAAEAKEREALLQPEVRAELKRRREALAELEKAAPEMPTAMGVADGRAADVPVHLRGSHLSLGEPVPRRFPRLLAGDDQPPLPAAVSGRLELARWIAGRDNPLSARVLVNRVWRWHFGEGLCRSPDNFGLQGEAPSHPELLDWLAARFVESGWSLKALHRTILFSSTYRMSSRHEPEAASKDPDNRLYWRAPIRRLEAEALRDALLAASGLLDTRMGGSLLHVANRAFLFDHTSRDETRYDSRRRSLYLPVIRNHLYDGFELFDATDATVSNGDRAATTVAPQALFLLNGELALEAARALASSLLAHRGDDRARVAELWIKAYARPPSSAETARILDAAWDLERDLEEREGDPLRRRLAAWQIIAQAVLASNEFTYVQ